MKVLDIGHHYELDSLEGTVQQELRFIKKMPDGAHNSVLKTIYDGVTNEEVLKALIDRMRYLQAKLSCRENAIVLTKLEESLMWLDYRAMTRDKQKKLGTNLPHVEDD